MDWMVQDPIPSPKKRRSRKGKGHITTAVPCECTCNMAGAVQIPDLNALPCDVEDSSPPPVACKKTWNRKKKSLVTSKDPSVTTQGITARNREEELHEQRVSR